MVKFPSIEQFRNIVKQVQLRHDFKGNAENGEPIYEHTSPYPIIDFTGTVKNHGSNGGTSFENGTLEEDYPFKPQSRENELTLLKDNMGFCRFIMEIPKSDMINLYEGLPFSNKYTIFGEWCGSSIQKGVAIAELSKRFIIFAVKCDDVWIDMETYHNELPNHNIYCITNPRFPIYKVSVDFNNLEAAAEIMEKLTMDVENECPVGKAFGVSGIGEGIVWASNNREYVFKTKGVKHQVKGGKIAATQIERQDLSQFIKDTVTIGRLNQGLEQLTDSKSKKNTGIFVTWMVNDILKEETDTILENNYDINTVKSDINVAARNWYLKQCD